jgi:hypothetical protein
MLEEPRVAAFAEVMVGRLSTGCTEKYKRNCGYYGLENSTSLRLLWHPLEYSNSEPWDKCETSDIVYNDNTVTLTCLIDRGYLGEMENKKPTYFNEVKTTVSNIRND